MSIQDQNLKDHLEKNLKAIEYHKEMMEGLEQAEELFRFMLSFIHKVVNSGRFNGSKLLEIGSGATVHAIASASAHFQNIVQSDYVTDNVDELRRWHKGNSVLDWSGFLKIVAELEGYTDLNVGVQTLASRIRKNVKCVVQSDVVSEAVVLAEELTPETKPPYDLIISCECLEATTTTFDGYVSVLKNINRILKPGGGLIVCGFENGGSWKVGKHEFFHLKLTIEQIKKAFDLAGFGNHDFQTHGKVDSDLYYEYQKMFCIATQKR